MLIIALCKALQAEKIQYSIVGGYAVALHGAVRGTVDLDLVLALNEETFIKAESIFLALGLVPRLPVNAKEVFNFRDEYIQKRNLIAWSFYNPLKPVQQLDIIITEDAAKMRTKTMMIHGTPIIVASIDDLIAMKTRSARPQDLEDVKALKILKEQKEQKELPKNEQ
ncbi:hypothetical protein WDW86_00995 [Bdellovibrionota bacterium FG-2]